MSMEIGVKTVGFELSPFESGGELGPEIRGRIMELLAYAVADIIWSRVELGVTPEGAPFKKYDPRYEKRKMAAGRMTHGGGAGKARGYWLNWSGQMLGSIKPLFFDGDRFLLGFDSGRGDGKSNALIAWVNEQTRPFFSLSEEEKTIAWNNTLIQARQEGLIK